MEQSRPLGLEHEEVPLKESSMSNASEEQVAALRTLYLKARPYACHSVACGKKYRNPGGLKYHYLHSGVSLLFSALSTTSADSSLCDRRTEK